MRVAWRLSVRARLGSGSRTGTITGRRVPRPSLHDEITHIGARSAEQRRVPGRRVGVLASSNTLHETEPKGLPGRHQRLRIDTIAAVACSSCCGRGRWEWESGCHRRRERWVLKGHKHRLVRIPANREAVRMLASSVHCSENPACPTKFRITAELYMGCIPDTRAKS